MQENEKIRPEDLKIELKEIRLQDKKQTKPEESSQSQGEAETASTLNQNANKGNGLNVGTNDVKQDP